MKLSANFNSSEFACPGGIHCCSNSEPVDSRIVTALQQLRFWLGCPLTINSGFRCREHNLNVGGSPDSYHCRGMAADVSLPECFTSARVAEIAEEIPAFKHGGIGLYDTFIHLDVRTNGPARWDERNTHS